MVKSLQREIYTVCTFQSNTRRSRIAFVFIILNTEIKNKSKISNNLGKDVFSNKKKKGNIITRDDVVSQRLKFGSAFLSSSWESKIVLFF